MKGANTMKTMDIGRSIETYLSQKLKHFKEIKFQEDGVVREFVQKCYDNLLDNPKFTGVWYLIDPIGRQPNTVTIREVIQTLERKVSRTPIEIEQGNTDYESNNIQGKLRSFFQDLTNLLSRGDGSGNMEIRQGKVSFSGGEFTLMEGAGRLIETVKALLDYEY
jgi:6-phosphogluconate dehydrogenase (decarboxylating)